MSINNPENASSANDALQSIPFGIPYEFRGSTYTTQNSHLITYWKILSPRCSFVMFISSRNKKSSNMQHSSRKTQNHSNRKNLLELYHVNLCLLTYIYIIHHLHPLHAQRAPPLWAFSPTSGPKPPLDPSNMILKTLNPILDGSTPKLFQGCYLLPSMDQYVLKFYWFVRWNLHRSTCKG